jgi:hypothetical protein
MSLNRAGRWAVWVSSCALAAITIVIAFRSWPSESLKSGPTTKQVRQQIAAVARPPRRAPAPQTMMTKAVRLRQHIAESTLRLNGIKLRSNGSCTKRRNSSCTSLDGIRRHSIDGLVAFRRQSRCRIVVSGGTEAGHAHGRYSHWNGYKIDVLPNRCVDRYISKRFRSAGVRGDGAQLHRSSAGVLYADEGSHWDLLFKNK